MVPNSGKSRHPSLAKPGREGMAVSDGTEETCTTRVGRVQFARELREGNTKRVLEVWLEEEIGEVED